MASYAENVSIWWRHNGHTSHWRVVSRSLLSVWSVCPSDCLPLDYTDTVPSKLFHLADSYLVFTRVLIWTRPLFTTTLRHFWNKQYGFEIAIVWYLGNPLIKKLKEKNSLAKGIMIIIMDIFAMCDFVSRGDLITLFCPVGEILRLCDRFYWWLAINLHILNLPSGVACWLYEEYNFEISTTRTGLNLISISNKGKNAVKGTQVL